MADQLDADELSMVCAMAFFSQPRQTPSVLRGMFLELIRRERAEAEDRAAKAKRLEET